MIDNEKLRYLLVGGANTVFGYCSGVFLYEILSSVLNIVFIAILINIVNISASFLTYKLFVFKSQSPWWKEYLRSYLVYGGSAMVGVALIWLLVDVWHIPFWIAQAIVILLTVTLSYLGHSKYTYTNKPNS
jgi:putative flippase GtrA